MRAYVTLAIAAMLVAAPAIAVPDTGAFLRKCRTGIPVATCNCVVDTLKQSRNGQITLDAFRLMEMPKDQQQTLAVELADKYETTLSGIQNAVNSARTSFDTAVKACL